MFYVYLYKHPLTGAILYVGKGKEDRIYYHLKVLKKYKKCKRFYFHNKLLSIYNETGLCAIPEFYACGLTEDNAKLLEIKLIAKYDRKDIDEGGILYNRTKGGDGVMHGEKHSEETKKKISTTLKSANRKMSYKTRTGLAKANIGRKMSEKSIQQQIEAKEKKRCYVIQTPDNQIVEVNSITTFAEQNNLGRAAGLLNSLSHGRPCDKGVCKGYWLLEIKHQGIKTKCELLPRPPL